MKTSHARILASLAVIVLLMGCSKKAAEAPAAAVAPPTATPAPAAVPVSKADSVALVPDAEKSRHFEAVNRHLELGGILYGYVDIDGDVMSFAEPMQGFVKDLAKAQPQLSMFAKQDFKELFKTMGLDDVKAVGVSSVKQADGLYRNRAFLYTPEGRHGLLSVVGGPPAPFVNTRMAPSDVDYYSEFDFDLGAIYDLTNSVIEKVNGPNAVHDFQDKLKQSGLLAYLGFLKGHATVIVKLDPAKNLTLPAPFAMTFPAFETFIKLSITAPSFEDTFKSDPKYEASTSGSMRIYTLKNPPVEGLNLGFGFDGSADYIFTSEAFMSECLARKEGLDKNPAFVAGLAALGPEGNGVSWVSTRFFSRMKDLGPMNDRAPAQLHKAIETFASSITDISQPLMSVRTNLPDGVLVRSVWNRSLKADMVVLAIYNPVTVGIMAAMAVPAFQKARQGSQVAAVDNNLAQLSTASELYFASHPGVTACRYSDLVGPDKPIKEMKPIAGEDYTQLIIFKGQILKVTLSDGRVINFDPIHMKRHNVSPYPQATQDTQGPTADDRPDAVAIKANLKALSLAADAYYKANGTTRTSFDKLVGPDKAIPSMPSVAGENYKTLLFAKGRPLRVILKDGRSFVYWPQ